MSTDGKILLWRTICELYLNSWPQNRFMINWIYIFTFFQARTMSYQQKVIENGNNSAAEDDPSRKTSLTSRPNIKELTHKQRNWFSSFEKNRSQEVVIFPSNLVMVPMVSFWFTNPFSRLWHQWIRCVVLPLKTITPRIYFPGVEGNVPVPPLKVSRPMPRLPRPPICSRRGIDVLWVPEAQRTQIQLRITFGIGKRARVRCLHLVATNLEGRPRCVRILDK